MRCFTWFVTTTACCVHMAVPHVRAGDQPDKSKPFGIERRIPLTTSRVLGFPDPPPPFRVERVFPKLKLSQPVYLIPEPGRDRWFVVQYMGQVLTFEDNPDVEKAELFLELEREVYSVTFHPDYANNGFIYVFSNGPREKKPRFNRIARYEVGREAPRRCDPKSELVVLEYESNGHNGGDLAFGPDGMLYITSGDGTSDSDTLDTGQDVSDLTSAIIRINVDHSDDGKNYAVPNDNPLLDVPGARPEIWAYGFRNPWRMSFDHETGNLWVGNVGQDLWELIHLVRRGDNVGWSIMEGNHPFRLKRRRGPTPIVSTTFDLPHSEARSITGGHVYRGSRFPQLSGLYVYGDYSTSKIWGLRHDGEKVAENMELANTTLQIVGFGQDRSGEILVVDLLGGFYRLVPAPAATTTSAFPRRLSETGLFDSVYEHRPMPALIPYSVNSPLWSDGAQKERFIALPGESRIDLTGSGGWNFEDGAVLVKSFSLELQNAEVASQRRIETRLLTRQQGQWYGYSYVWNDEQTDATLVESAGMDRTFTVHDPAAPGGSRAQTWHYPSRTECMVCHSRAANWVLGLSTLQMNKDHDYGAVTDNQLRSIEHLGVFRVNTLEHVEALEAKLRSAAKEIARSGPPDRPATADLPAPARQAVADFQLATQLLDASLAGRLPPITANWAAQLASVRKQFQEKPQFSTRLPRRPHEYPRLPDPYDESASLETRARSYLHANCSQCHVEAGGGNSLMGLSFSTPLDKMRILNEPPQHDSLGIEHPLLVAPGDPDRSLLYHRMTKLGEGRMPPLASSVVDQRAAQLLYEWIKQMKLE